MVAQSSRGIPRQYRTFDSLNLPNIKMRISYIPVLLAVMLLFFGCATRKEIVRFQEDTQVMRSDLEEIKRQQALMMEALSSLDAELNEVSARTEYGSSSMEERVGELTARLDDIIGKMDRTLAPLEEFVRRGLGDTSAAVIGMDLYDAAMQDLSLGNYDLAEVSFTRFLEQNPSSELADDARYGLAESFYARRRYTDAEMEYLRVIDMDPNGLKAPGALLKLGLCYKAEGRKQDARRVWTQLTEDFPSTEEAKAAQQRISEL
jgi:tol-pal system protein YbgF